ncbi:MurR/RpiR family transcriptional regulator [Clostridioides difficile]|uniref:MurR/RpiR family transcriptional regulator n=1 Tax=Clostridioides difficile TaxID=1496 RepID=A0A9P3WVN9_CLODI|nr:MurR/RpiR family transcriptional regulator [Clostridioides difficile]AWH77008.1 MurR/RpiR family transcriptional regulator [Clostridioides difficile]AWH80774.1 MurR/RpiR family transcriptional regulator [Clostridioides difficile]AXU45880.1 transcriptional regulator [Clostridioides difficile]EGT2213701.1 SIS domain-containing protein [Clostridioides difficile]EGT3892455.1 MurR/RpiR family transcriptional regulator [Clostridioides difficile]
MNLIDKLDINRKKLSTNEISLLNYFLKNSEKINQKKIKDIANETFNSTAYIVRFCQKLGFSGYSEFKNFLVFSYSNRNERNKEFTKSQSDIFTDVMDTQNLINVENIDMCLNEIHNSKHIYFFGVGSSRLVCTEMSQRFSAIGVNVKYYDDSTLMYLAASNITKDDLVIAVSMSGETAQVIKACNIAKTNQVKVISLTNISVNSLSNIADIKLFVSSPQYNFNSVNYTSRVPALSLMEYMFHKYIEKYNR